MTLTQAAALSKRVLLTIVGLIVAGTVFFVGYNLYLSSRPKPPVIEEKPEAKYGALPAPLLDNSVADPASYSYSLNTTTGSLPTDLPKILNVYYVPNLGVTLLAPDRVRDLANSLSFNNGPDIQNQTDYRFSDSSSGVLSIDLTTANFNLVRPEPTNDVENSNLKFENQDNLTNAFKNFLGSKNLLNDQISSGRSQVVYNGATPDVSTEATISIWPADLNELPVVTPKDDTSLINATVSKFQDSPEHYLKLNYTYWPADQTNVSTYPLRTAQQAFDDLKAGNGSLVLIPSSHQVSITSVELAYFESDHYLPYIEPVYLFKGDNFLAYVPAISSELLAK